MTLNGITLEWKDPSDLPSMCCQCPFFFSGSTYVPGVPSSPSDTGICNLRNMNKDSGPTVRRHAFACSGRFSSTLRMLPLW